MIYFDNAATTKVDKDIYLQMLEFNENNYANVDSIHNFGINTYKIIEEKKYILEKIFKINKDLFYFTSGGGEANNICISSVLNLFNKGHVISTTMEHPSVYECIQSYSNKFDITYINPKLEKLSFDMIKEHIKNDTVLISLTSCNSEIGIIYDIDEIAKQIKKIYPNIYIHTDFVQALGHKLISLEHIDLLSISSHKIHGPKGIGAMYIKKNTKLKQFVYGDNKKNGIIKRTLPTDLVYGFLLALEKIYNKDEIEYINNLKKYTIDRLKEIFENKIYIIENNSFNILSFSIQNLWSEILFNYLSSKKIYISVGAACSTGASKISKSIGLDKTFEKGLVRLSFSKNNTKEEIDTFILEMNNFKKYIR